MNIIERAKFDKFKFVGFGPFSSVLKYFKIKKKDFYSFIKVIFWKKNKIQKKYHNILN